MQTPSVVLDATFGRSRQTDRFFYAGMAAAMLYDLASRRLQGAGEAFAGGEGDE